MDKLSALIMDKAREKYKLVGLALRWAQEIKVKNNLPDPIQKILPRAVEELLDGTVSRETVEELINKGSQPSTVVEAAAREETQKAESPAESETRESSAADKKPAKEKAKAKKTTSKSKK